jgi:hypothetical protein
MRERTTWNREQIAKLAAGKKADDPSVLNNPEHLKAQPSADKYVTGDPSTFAEDVHPSTNTWKAEYSGGEVKRNEIGMPEIRNDTFNHPEKTAAEQDDEDDDFLQKKADVCINLAKRMLGKNASEQALEDQALAFMHMPDSAIVATATRLADQQGDGQEQQSQQEKQAQQQQTQQEQSEEQKQAAKKAQQDQAQESEEQKQAAKRKAQQDQGQQDKQDKEAGQIPENFKKKDDEEEGDEQQKKQAALGMYSQQACDALMKGDTTAAQQAVQQMVQMSQGQPQQQMSQEQAKQQVDEMFAQAMQQMGQGQPAQQQPTMADDQLLDQMLQQQQQPSQQMMASAAPGASMDIELQSTAMDVGEAKLGSEDEALATLFASNAEVRDAAQALAIQGLGTPHQASAAPMTRTASTRTVGTRPTGGVAQLGGGASGGEASSSDIDKLSGLWSSAPDVSNVFSS